MDGVIVSGGMSAAASSVVGARYYVPIASERAVHTGTATVSPRATAAQIEAIRDRVRRTPH